jgi:hypothetical protein
MKLTGSDRPIDSDLKHHAWKSSPETWRDNHRQKPGGMIIARNLAG